MRSLPGGRAHTLENSLVRAPMPKTVLVADDSDMIRKLLCRLFETEEDYELCAEAKNGEEAISLAVIHKPDLIIMDVSMPVMDGLRAAKKLKQIMPDTPILLFTQHADLRMMFEDVPADRVISKTDLVSLMQHVRELAPAR
jgi:CheY-like chemotaxis protein